MELGKRWSEPHRSYHDLDHLREVLDALELLAGDGLAFDLSLARRAAWFHDAVYDVHRDDNEERSADLARWLLPDLMAAPVVRLVLATKDHDPDPDDVEAAALCDADLAILAAGTARYRSYAQGIREEYEHVPEMHYRTERVRVLTALLDKDCLYTTSPGQVRWEAKARLNVLTEIESMTP